MKRYLLPLVFFLVLVGFLAAGLRLKPRELPSPLINKPVPAFSLATLSDPAQKVSPQDLRGKVWILNVWASWCGPCRDEHPVLMQLAKDGRFNLVGLNYKDAPENARRFLGQYGLPYQAVGVDPKGRAAIDWGVYGVPETFVTRRDGRAGVWLARSGRATWTPVALGYTSGTNIEVSRGLKAGDVVLSPAGRYSFEPVDLGEEVP